MTIDDDEPLTRRLAETLEAEARRNMLPPDYAASVTDGLPDRRQSLMAVAGPAAIAVTAVLAVAAVAVGVSLLPRPAGTASPTPAASTSAAPGLAHYAAEGSLAGGISFDYPADWHIIQQGIVARHYQWVPVVLGTGDWHLNCQLIPPSGDSVGGTTCGQDIFTVGTGQIVVEIYAWQGPPGATQTPPPGAAVLPAGWRAVVADTASSSTWRIYLPGWLQPLTVEARFAGPDSEDARSQVKRLVESLAVSPTLLGSPEPTNPPPAP